MLRVKRTPKPYGDYVEIHASQNAYDDDNTNYNLLLKGSELYVDIELAFAFYDNPEFKDHVPIMDNLEIAVDDKIKQWITTIKEYLIAQEAEDSGCDDGGDDDSDDSAAADDDVVIVDYGDWFIGYNPLTPPPDSPDHDRE